MAPDKEQAKRIILETLRQACGELDKTKLFNAFWLAHLFFASKARGYLSDWSVVRMPKGPGIASADRLLKELSDSNALQLHHVPKGPFTEICCRLTDKDVDTQLDQAQKEAIREAVDYVNTHSAEAISELGHQFSRSWNRLADGEELNIYTDLIPDDVYGERQKELAKLKQAYEELFE